MNCQLYLGQFEFGVAEDVEEYESLYAPYKMHGFLMLNNLVEHDGRGYWTFHSLPTCELLCLL